MFKPTDSQGQLFDASYQLSDSARRRLKDTWAPLFRQRVMPILLKAEEDFADLYPSDTGRGCWSVARKLGICLLQELMNLSDRKTVDALCFDVRWHYALMLQPDEAYLSRISIWDFRCRLVESDPEMERLGQLLERIGKEAAEALGLDISKQRCDSTHITSNIEVKGRGDLFRKTLRYFDDWLQEEWSEQREKLNDELIEWFDADAESWFGRLSEEQYQARLEQMAVWMVEIVELFSQHDQISSHERYELLVQLIDEHCVIEKVEVTEKKTAKNGKEDRSSDHVPLRNDVANDDQPSRPSADDGQQDPSVEEHSPNTEQEKSTTVRVRSSPDGGSSTLQSPYDPDAGYTDHKGTGYSMHIVETCGNEAIPEMILHQQVYPAETDCGRMSRILHRLDLAGLAPKVMLADAGYGTGGEVLKARHKGTELLSPIPRGNQSKERFGRERFDIDDQTGQVRRCPAGHKPHRHGMRRSASRRKGKALHAYFYPSQCGNCEMFDNCPAKKPDSKKGAYQLELRSTQRARDHRLAEQKTDEFWDRYGLRSGVEATASELKRAHGVGKLRVRRLPKVRMKAAFKSCACNVKRWAKAA